jgi:hypothetical protein
MSAFKAGIAIFAAALFVLYSKERLGCHMPVMSAPR